MVPLALRSGPHPRERRRDELKNRAESHDPLPTPRQEEEWTPVLGTLQDQAERLIAAGVTEKTAGLSAEGLRQSALDVQSRVPHGSLLVVSERVLPASVLTPLLRRSDSGSSLRGFVVEDMTDVDSFTPTIETMPEDLVYAVADVARGDGMRNWSPAEATETLAQQGREPLTLVEGIHWALQEPDVLTRNACYMTIGSRRPKGKGFDARTPALWISNGTGRDGRARKGAPKVGWCWWNNRHTWLGFASCSERHS